MRSVAFNQTTITPSKIVCVGRNYLKHIHELNNQVPDEPVLFIKPNSSLSDCLVIPANRILHYEAELSFMVIDHHLKAVAIGLDLTDRALQTTLKQKGLPWEKAKAFDSSAVFSKFILLEDESLIKHLSFALYINNQLKQKGDYAHMIYKPQMLIYHIEQYFSMLSGDILMTGTPEGVGEIKLGDTFKVELYLNEKMLLRQSWQASL
ncbi:fumarylacetoacetate hydrolase family protein [Fastidiosibacter lacustris]|uniref:fumarylacetoacetate hydrolase family protein n=1 Tax=Fastidiosibacter lacustris TaxID=2056695 RepID=UPI000E34EA94|nr:fumarylacetoacetate hydrolase family protein [Fastidiosibacter lacustris]